MKRSKDKSIAEAFTWENILDKIKLCDKLKDLREKYTSEYRAALGESGAGKMLYQLLSSRKNQAIFNNYSKPLCQL